MKIQNLLTMQDNKMETHTMNIVPKETKQGRNIQMKTYLYGSSLPLQNLVIKKDLKPLLKVFI